MTSDQAHAARSRHGRWNAQTWFNVVLLAMAVLLAVSAVFGASVLRTAAQASNRLIDQITVGRLQAERMQTSLLNQETGLRGFVITGKEEFLQPYEDGLSAQRAAAAQVRTVASGERALGRLESVERLSERWRSGYAEPMIEAVRRSGPSAVSQLRAEESKTAFDAVRRALDDQNAAWSAARDRARAELERSRTTRDTTFFIILVGFLLTIITVAVLLRVAVFRPLARLGEASRRVTGGDFSHHVDTGGPADLAALSSDMEAMRLRIVTELEEARGSRQQIAAQAEELKRSNAELEQFAYVASHDLQEPLRKIASFCQMLQQRYSDQLDERANTYIDFAVDGAKRMQVLINELLTFSRVGRVRQEPAPAGLNEMIGHALSNLAAAVEESDAEIEVGDLPVVVGDRTQLVMLWQNLIGNSLKFRTPGKRPHIRIEAERSDGEWRISLTDNGIGIPPHFADKIFVIFQRLHHRDAYEGTGIGLALCRKIVEQHQGRIWLDTEYTEGARFVLTLPVADVPDAPDVSGDEAGAERTDVPAPSSDGTPASRGETAEPSAGVAKDGKAARGEAGDPKGAGDPHDRGNAEGARTESG
ncbi:sensor histidine kinase [Streptosporangium sandarakinum]|uniref:sensor histidine kinase n=1 Tax=Streptosporangium sandarakinum TaxID=1260955 RepID=UPI0033A2F10C